MVGALAGRLRIGERLWIATKVWTTGEEAGVRQMEASMALLRRRRIELMQFDNLVDRSVVGTPVPESVRAFAGSWPQAFLKFILAHPAVTCVIPGTGNPRHMRDNLQAGVRRLPDAGERAALLRSLGIEGR